MNNKAKISNFIKIIIILLIVLLILVGFFIFFNKNKNPGQTIVLENPLKQIVIENTKDGIINQNAVIQQGIIKFNENYINFLLAALGISELQKSSLGYGNPKIELILDNEVWNSELGDVFITSRGNSNDPDLRIRMKKEEAVIALLTPDIKEYMKNLVQKGKIEIEMVAGKIELFSKGYLEMSKNLGYEISI